MANIVLLDHTAAQKLNYLKYRLSRKGQTLSYDPVNISIVSTGRCTLSCDMCPTHSKIVSRDYPYLQKASRDMDFDTFRKVIDRFSSALSVHIIGSGEPMLNKDFFRMVDYAFGKKMSVKTFSNGTTIGENIDNLLRSRLSGITVSINGHNAEEFERMTGMSRHIYRDIFASTKKLIEERNSSRARLKVNVSHIIDKQNFRSIPEMIRVSVDIGADIILLCNFLSCPYDGLTADERVLEADEEVMKEIELMKSILPAGVLKRVVFPRPVDKKLLRNICDSHFMQIRVDGDGNISSCSMMLLGVAGAGRYDDAGAWNNDFFRRMRRSFLSDDESLLPEPCRVCPDNKGVKIEG